jgi:micrococcal nuclease
MVFGNEVTVHTKTRDKYGRTVADVTLLDGTNLNHELVKQGWCWWFRKYAPNDEVLKTLQEEARHHKRGLWVAPNSVSPWEFRKLQAEERAKKKAAPLFKQMDMGMIQGHSTTTVAPGGMVAEHLSVPILGNKRIRIYHRADCPNYSEIAVKNQVQFMSESAAQQAGYRLAGNCPRLG